MDIEFDPAKDAANIEKHGVSLSRAVALKVFAVIADARFEEERYRAYGLLDGEPYCPSPTQCAVIGSARSVFAARMQRSTGVMSDKKPVVFDDDNPEWTEADFARAVKLNGVSLAEATQAIRRARGRPPVESPKPQVTLRLDPDVLAHFKATGRGWQTRINETLRKAVGL